MSDTELTLTQIEFLQHHIPKIKSGSYRLELKQCTGFKGEVTHKDAKDGKEEKELVEKSYEAFPSFSQTFSIRGERFKLNPQDIVSVFPPADSSGDHANVIPHVILRRSTLPWERTAQKQVTTTTGELKPEPPWLAVLLFDADEAPSPQVISLKTLYEETAVFFPTAQLPREPDDEDDEQITIIDVPGKLLKELAPSPDDLRYMAHVRRTVTHDNQKVERAVVIGNRIGQRGRALVAHLVSLENRYDTNGQIQIGDKTLTRLVTLKSWRYHCLDETSYQLTEHTLTGLTLSDNEKAALRPLVNKEFVGQDAFLSQVNSLLALETTQQQIVLKAARYKKLSFKSLLMELNRGVLQLPASALSADTASEVKAVAQTYLQRGSILLPSHLRNGQCSAAWYHGPFIAGENKTSLSLPVRVSDALLQYDATYGLFDVSYAAAWELGRLLALQSKQFSLALYNWKRSVVMSTKDTKTQLTDLPLNTPSVATVPPDLVRDWLYELSLCQGVPFNYLVPDERMLPKESIRFFQVEKAWITSLLDGAFSVGRVSGSDHEHETRMYEQFGSPLKLARQTTSGQTVPNGIMSGFLLRSELISGWPDLQVDGFTAVLPTLDNDSSRTSCGLLRMERLSPNVLLCLFDGVCKTVDIHQKPEGLHYGLSEPDSTNKSYYKRLRDPYNGHELVGKDDVVEVDLGANNKVSISSVQTNLASKLKPHLKEDSTAPSAGASFALQMVEGVERVRFMVSES